MSGVLGNLEKRVVKRVENVLGPKLDKMINLLQKENEWARKQDERMQKQNELLSVIITLLKK